MNTCLLASHSLRRMLQFWEKKERKNHFIATIIVTVILLVISIWPIVVKDNEISSLGYAAIHTRHITDRPYIYSLQ
jgi:hypothetical protein